MGSTANAYHKQQNMEYHSQHFVEEDYLFVFQWICFSSLKDMSGDLWKIYVWNLFSSSFCKKKVLLKSVSIVVIYVYLFQTCMIPSLFSCHQATEQHQFRHMFHYNARSHYYNALNTVREGVCTWWIENLGNILNVPWRSTQKKMFKYFHS